MLRLSLLLVILVLASVSCAPKEIQVIQRHAPNALSQITPKSKRVHVVDSLLSQYLGRWESDKLIMSYDSIGKWEISEKGQVSMDVLYGRLWIIGEGAVSTAFNVKSPSYSKDIITLISDSYRLRGDLKFDSTRNGILNWHKSATLRTGGIVITKGNKDLSGRIILHSYEALPQVVPLNKVK